ncbi:MAG: peptidoglycan DD-metalloendopeptidase family protein [Ilumatobacter sp.]|uniref:peptidoglycan DD-metalloendopeptidase family protein n=1 Tax=Ilumatobacter sp. TaxID=1967498 RepID=UPI003C75CBE2
MLIVGNLRRRMRLVTAMLLVIATASAIVPGVVSAQSESPADKAAREIQEARDQANAAADAFFQAESDLEQLEDDLAGLVVEEAQLQVTVDDLRSQVEVVALSRYIASGTEGIPLLTNVSEPQDQIQADVFAEVLTNTGADTLDQYEAADKALGEKQDEVAQRQDEVAAQREQFADLEEAALGEVERLREIETERLKDEAVQQALDARLAAERAELEERARLDAEAAARAQPNPGLVVPPSTEPPPETTTTTIDPNAPVPTDASGEPVPVTDPPPPASTEPPVTSPPETTIPENTGGSGGTSGGRTGGGGGGNGPGAINTGGVFVDQIICPLPGSAYGDTWGAPRSGGRRHEGVDMIAPRGLPIYAVIGGMVTFKSNRLGGNAVSLAGDNGNRYYYAHLDSYVGGSRRVFQGELIGYNGDSGNARFSTPHLHFQVHPGGGRPVNPYPTVRAAGC